MSLKPFPQFEVRAVRDEEATKSKGREILKDEDWVVLVVDQNLQVPKRVESWLRDLENKVLEGKEDSQKAERYRLAYEYWKKGQEAPLEGTDIRVWPQITKATAQNYINAGVRTVEDLAEAHDAQLQKLGPGAREMQNKARAYLTATEGKSAEEIVALKEEIANKDIMIEDLQGNISEFQKQIADLQKQLADVQASESKTEKPAKDDTKESSGKKK